MTVRRNKQKGRSLAVLALAVLMTACGSQGETAQDDTPPPVVETLTLTPTPFTVSSRLPGRIEPLRIAEVRARVAGIVLERNFEEGAEVEAGQLLFQIDPAPFRAALSRAQGQLAVAAAEVSEAQTIVDRYTPLTDIAAVSRQDFDAAMTRLTSAQAARQTAQADVETARLNLDYASVRAPIAGRIGRALVTEGALVGQNEATPLATIQQIDSVYVDFKQPVGDLLRLREALAEGRLSQNAEGAHVSVTIDGTSKQRDGHLLFSDITVDRGTGQVSMRAQISNPDNLLLPGMYVRVHIGQGVDTDALLIPQRAVRRGTDAKAEVLVVGQDNIVESREVVTGDMHGSKWHILEGLQPGDRLIVGGQAEPGQQVQTEASLAAPQSNVADARRG